jgi:hypothetical protein
MHLAVFDLDSFVGGACCVLALLAGVASLWAAAGGRRR